MSIGRTLTGILVLAASVCVVAQTTETRPPDIDTSKTAGSAVERAARAAAAARGNYSATPAPNPCRSRRSEFNQAEILTDTMGVDFGPYLKQITEIVRRNWYSLMPESVGPPMFKQGKLSIEFVILKDGKTRGMVVHTSSGDMALDRAAWGSITASTRFPPLPKEFSGQTLGLRFYYFYNLSPDTSWIIISPCGDVQVSTGSTLQFSISGSGSTDTSVKWSLSGGFTGFCLESSCGSISDAGLYTAPVSVPSRPTVTVEATSRTDPSIVAKSKVTVVQAAPPQ